MFDTESIYSIVSIEDFNMVNEDESDSDDSLIETFNKRPFYSTYNMFNDLDKFDDILSDLVNTEIILFGSNPYNFVNKIHMILTAEDPNSGS